MTRFARQHQRGFGALAYLLAALAVLAALATLYTLVDGRGYERGKSETESAYAKRDNQALRDAIDAKDKAEREKAALEKQNAELVAAASKTYQEGLAHGKQELDAALARARAGQRLRDPGRTGCAPVGAVGSAPATGAGAGGRDGQAGAELSAEAGDFLLRLAGEADDVARQLAACQAVVEADRR